MARKSKKRSSSTALAPRRHASPARRVGGRRSAASRARVDVTGPLMMAALFGILEREGISIPHFGAVGEMGTLAIAGFVALKAGVVPAGMRRTVENAVLVAGSMAVYDLAKSGTFPGGSKVKGEGPWQSHPTEGDDD